MMCVELDFDDSVAVVMETMLKPRPDRGDVLFIKVSYRTGRFEPFDYIGVHCRWVGDEFSDDDRPTHRPVNVIGLTNGFESDPDKDFVSLGIGTLLDEHGTSTFPRDRTVRKPRA